ncbi:hypothetical protein BKA69DRAFT_461300 [Paraphysoderma sedebokerense]|nr:hypothetical protein BKA69DRAFT_461300 [Paraphysoderma sedebokerense]
MDDEERNEIKRGNSTWIDSRGYNSFNDNSFNSSVDDIHTAVVYAATLLEILSLSIMAYKHKKDFVVSPPKPNLTRTRTGLVPTEFSGSRAPSGFDALEESDKKLILNYKRLIEEKKKSIQRIKTSKPNLPIAKYRSSESHSAIPRQKKPPSSQSVSIAKNKNPPDPNHIQSILQQVAQSILSERSPKKKKSSQQSKEKNKIRVDNSPKSTKKFTPLLDAHSHRENDILIFPPQNADTLFTTDAATATDNIEYENTKSEVKVLSDLLENKLTPLLQRTSQTVTKLSKSLNNTNEAQGIRWSIGKENNRTQDHTVERATKKEQGEWNRVEQLDQPSEWHRTEEQPEPRPTVPRRSKLSVNQVLEIANEKALCGSCQSSHSSRPFHNRSNGIQQSPTKSTQTQTTPYNHTEPYTESEFETGVNTFLNPLHSSSIHPPTSNITHSSFPLSRSTRLSHHHDPTGPATITIYNSPSDNALSNPPKSLDTGNIIILSSSHTLPHSSQKDNPTETTKQNEKSEPLCLSLPNSLVSDIKSTVNQNKLFQSTILVSEYPFLHHVLENGRVASSHENENKSSPHAGIGYNKDTEGKGKKRWNVDDELALIYNAVDQIVDEIVNEIVDEVSGEMEQLLDEFVDEIIRTEIEG